jgi:hypothetical protein
MTVPGGSFPATRFAHARSAVGRIREAEVLLRHVLKYVFRQVVNEDRQQRKATPEVDAVDTFCRSRHVSFAPDFIDRP